MHALIPALLIKYGVNDNKSFGDWSRLILGIPITACAGCQWSTVKPQHWQALNPWPPDRSYSFACA